MNLDFFENKYFFAIFVIFITLYAVQIRPTLPLFMVNLFQNPIFRVVILFLILVRGYKDPQFAILVAISFVLIMNVINEQIFKERFSETVPEGCPKTKEELMILSEKNARDIKVLAESPSCAETDQTCTTNIANLRSVIKTDGKRIVTCSS